MKTGNRQPCDIENLYLNDGTGNPCTGQIKLVSAENLGLRFGSIRLAFFGTELPIGSKR